MISRVCFFCVFAMLAGCATSPTQTDDADDVSDTVQEDPVVVTVPPEPEPVEPDACELLLARMDADAPLIQNIDATLDERLANIEQSLARLNRPRPIPKPPVCPASDNGVLGSKEIIGAIEWLYMDPPGRHYRARVDSGAETSSLSANNVVEFERDGDDWVRFEFQHNGSDDAVELELPIKRTVLIRQVSSDEPQRRVVVELDIRLGEQLQATEFTLTDRSSMTYPVLLGRAFLLDYYVVDVSRSYTHDKYEAR